MAGTARAMAGSGTMKLTSRPMALPSTCCGQVTLWSSPSCGAPGAVEAGPPLRVSHRLTRWAEQHLPEGEASRCPGEFRD